MSSILMTGRVMKGEIPSRVAERTSILGVLGLNTVSTRTRKRMASRRRKRKIAPTTL